MIEIKEGSLVIGLSAENIEHLNNCGLVKSFGEKNGLGKDVIIFHADNASLKKVEKLNECNKNSYF